MFTSRAPWVFGFAIGFCACPQTFAADESSSDDLVGIFGDMETVSIATGRAQTIDKSPAVATVITSNDIKRVGARSLEEILALVPGIHIGRLFWQNEPIVAVRGFSSSFNQTTLIMLDGVPQTDLVFGDRRYTLGTIPIPMIDRVEVFRGPGSALHGADAFSAVVNIITKQDVPLQSEVVVGAGSYDSASLQATGGVQWNGIKIVGGIEYKTTDGDSPLITADQQTSIDNVFGTAFSLAPGDANNEREEIGARVNIGMGKHSLLLRGFAWNDIGQGIGVGTSLDPFGSTENTGFEVTYAYEDALNEHWRWSTQADATQTEFSLRDIHVFPPGAFGVYPDGVISNHDYRQRFYKLRAGLEFRGFKNHVIDFGIGGESAEYKWQSESRNYLKVGETLIPTGGLVDVSDTPFLGAKEIGRDLTFVFAQNEWRLAPDWTLTLGVRHDHYSDFGGTTNSRAALVWDARYNLTLKLLYGEGFRAPSLLETRADQVVAITPNRDLQPERLRSIEFAADYRATPNVHLRGSVFYHETEDQIRQQNSGGVDFTPENVGDQTGYGGELELWWDLSRHWDFYGFYAYQDNTDETTGADAGYTPHHKLYAMLEGRFGDLSVVPQITYIGARDRILEDTSRSEADRYTFVDLLLRYRLSPNVELGIQARNLFDKQAEEASFGTSLPGDIPLPGRHYFFTVSGRF